MNDFITRFVLLAALFTVFGCVSLRAQSFEHDGLTYNVTGGNEVEVSGYTVEPVNLVIPATVSYEGMDYEVTAVGEWAFYGSSNLVSIEFPDFIKSIGSYAFANCIGLTSVSLPEGLTEMTMGTFIGCTGLVSVSFPSNLKSFGTGTFEGCTGLTSLSLPENLTDTGWGAFRDCIGLVSVNFPSGLTNIGRETFWGCTNLPSVDLPENLASIGDDAFYTCSSLASIDLPASLSSLGAGVFSGCTGLTSINVDSGNSFYCSQDGILFTKDMTELICYPAAKEGEHYAVPSGVVIICDEAFDSSYNLTSVDLPEGLISIGAGAFSGCSLISIDLPESLVSIGASAFYGKNWTSLVLPENLRSVEYGAFSWSETLVSVAILSDTLEIDGQAVIRNATGLVYAPQDSCADDSCRRMNEMYVPRGAEFNLVLSDGSHVWLNSDSRLRYPSVFRGDVREVEVSGEVFFEVARDERSPFVVKVEGLEVVVLGTKFNVNTRVAERIQTTLVEGQVAVNLPAGQSVVLEPGEMASANVVSGEVRSEQVNVQKYVAWRYGRFCFEEATMEEIMRELALWYDVEVEYRNGALKSERFTGSLPRSESIMEILKKIEQTTYVHFHVAGNRIIIGN